MTDLAHLFHVARRVTGRGGRASIPPHLLLNLSFVLHESSSSEAVRRTANAAALYVARSTAVCTLDKADIVVDGSLFVPDEWLTASVGYPQFLTDTLDQFGLDPRPTATVDGTPATRRHPFFRAPARLAFGSHGVNDARTVGVVALVARPGSHAAQLIVRGPYDPSEGFDLPLRQVEALIQSYADQWMPGRALWDAPAEVLLGDEVR